MLIAISGDLKAVIVVGAKNSLMNRFVIIVGYIHLESGLLYVY